MSKSQRPQGVLHPLRCAPRRNAQGQKRRNLRNRDGVEGRSRPLLTRPPLSDIEGENRWCVNAGVCRTDAGGTGDQGGEDTGHGEGQRAREPGRTDRGRRIPGHGHGASHPGTGEYGRAQAAGSAFRRTGTHRQREDEPEEDYCYRAETRRHTYARLITAVAGRRSRRVD